MSETSPQPGRPVDPPRRGIFLFRVFGIEVHADLSWFLIFALITLSLAYGYFPSQLPGLLPSTYLVAGLVASLLFFSSILLHELSHSVVAKRLGIEVPSITLFLFGGVSQLRDEPSDPQKELAITIAGPLMSFALAFVFGLVWFFVRSAEATPISQTFLWLSWINFALAVFNLMPGLPLDGGRVLRAFLWWRHGSIERATRTASRAGKALAMLLILGGFLMVFYGNWGGIWLILIGMFLRSAAEASYQDLVLKRALQDARVAQAMIPDVQTVPPDITLREFVDEHVLRHGFRGFPVREGDEVLGVISLDQVKGAPREVLDGSTVREHMVRLSPRVTTSPEAPLVDALRRMSASGVGRLLVLEDGELIGMITKEGLLRFVEARRVLGGPRGDAPEPSLADLDEAGK